MIAIMDRINRERSDTYLVSPLFLYRQPSLARKIAQGPGPKQEGDTNQILGLPTDWENLPAISGKPPDT
jgi:hypothetical protein